MGGGFESEANAIAQEVRGELGLAPAAPLNVWRLAEHLEMPVIPLSGLRESAPLAANLFLNAGQGMFSGVTVSRGNEGPWYSTTRTYRVGMPAMLATCLPTDW